MTETKKLKIESRRKAEVPREEILRMLSTWIYYNREGRTGAPSNLVITDFLTSGAVVSWTEEEDLPYHGVDEPKPAYIDEPVVFTKRDTKPREIWFKNWDDEWVRATHMVMHDGFPSPAVKEVRFFIDLGGLTERWGRNWLPVKADSVEAARALAVEMKKEEGQS